MLERQPYQGPARKLVLAFDVGTTYSGVSYSILDPGRPPVICGVTRFPATEHIGGNSRIPSIAYYDLDGVPRAFGCEALQEYIIESAEEEEWVKTEWWMLHLRPQNVASSQVSDQDVPPLPPNRTAVQVLSDFMEYLFRCTKTYIQESHASGRDVWALLENDIDFVLSYPNGWEGPQQAQIRQAAVLAGLVPDSLEGQARIQLVNEGEAKACFCLSSETTVGSFDENQGITVIDAGSGTIDVRSYCMTTLLVTFQLEEIAPAECCLQGGVFVTRRAEEFLRRKLANSRYGTPEFIADMMREFDKTTKLRFNNPAEPSYIRFGTIRDRDLAFNIKSGQLKIPGTDVAALFKPSITVVIAALESQRRLATTPINTIFLIGDFAASDWLFLRLQEHIRPLNLNLCRLDSHADTVADGALAFYLNKVSARVSRFTYGTRCSIEFNTDDEQHRLRIASVIPRPSGRMLLPNAFSIILHKGTMVLETTEFRKDFITECAQGASGNFIATEIVCYRGDASNPRWTDSELGMFSDLCTVHADTSQVPKTLCPRRGFAGLQFYRQQFSIVLMFGSTGLQAQLSWMENGEEKRGPATVVFDEIIEEI